MNINIAKTASNVIDESDQVFIFSSFEHKVFNSGSEAIELKFQVTDGNEEGKIVKMNLWPYGTEKGAKFAQVRMAQIAQASGLTGDLNGEDYDEILNGLLNRVVGGHVIIKTDEYGTKNEISYFMEVSKVKKPQAQVKKLVAQKPVAQDQFEDDLI